MTSVFEKDYYYISTGSGNKMYTLRHFYSHPTVRYDGDYYVTTLCVDSDRAIEKAREYLKKKYADIDKTPHLRVPDIKLDLDEITRSKRRSVDEIEATRMREAIVSGIIAGIKKKKKDEEWRLNANKKLDSGWFPFKHSKQSDYEYAMSKNWLKIEDMNIFDINYWASLTEYKSDVHERLSEMCKPFSRYIPKNKNKHFGNVGDKKVKVKAMIISKEECDYGYGDSLNVKYITEEGHKLTTHGSVNSVFNKSISEDYEICDWIEFEATIKAHNSFDPSEDSTWDFGRKIVFKEGDGKVVYKTTKLIRPKLIS